MTKLKAESKAKNLANHLNRHFNTIHWQPKVWENFGWHYNVVLGSISVRESRHQKNRYYALVDSEKNCANGGLSSWTDQEGKLHEKPEIAVLMAMMKATEYVRQLETVLTDNIEKLNLKEY